MTLYFPEKEETLNVISALLAETLDHGTHVINHVATVKVEGTNYIDTCDKSLTLLSLSTCRNHKDSMSNSLHIAHTFFYGFDDSQVLWGR